MSEGSAGSGRDLTGRVAMVTGAGSGIGLAAAKRLAGMGARIVAADRSEKKLAATVRELPGNSRPIVLPRADLRPAGAGKAVVADGLKAAGRIDVLVNSAGVCHFRAMKDVTPTEWDEVLEVNVRTLFETSVAMAEAVDPARGGRIINLGSNAGRKGRPLMAHYAAAKAAVANLTESLAIAYGKKNITANTVCPAVTDTPMWNNLFDELNAATGKTKDELTDGWRKSTPLGRLGTVDDVASLIAFLASDEAAFITGQTINVCGGFMLTC